MRSVARDLVRKVASESFELKECLDQRVREDRNERRRKEFKRVLSRRGGSGRGGGGC